MKKFVLYDNERYILSTLDTRINKGYYRCMPRETLTLECIDNGMTYRGVGDSQNGLETLAFLELAGGIYLEPLDNAVIYSMKRTLYESHISGHYIHIEYDGITHITIENRDYIYSYDIPYYADIECKLEDNICLFLIKYCDYTRIIVLKCDEDYVELLNMVGNEVRIGENSIIIERRYVDSLGRVGTSEYELIDDAYQCVNTSFEYTYRIVYTESVRTILLEDAVISRDYEYIRERMSTDVSADDLRAYFESILGEDIHTLRCEDISDTMHFVTSGERMPRLIDIHVCYDKDGNITNLEEVKDAE